MKVLGVFRKRFADIQTPPLNLKQAQVVEGKITKIYPQNKAEIQIGKHTLIAEVSTALTLGQRYFFEVQGMTEPIHLKVIAEADKPSHQTPTIHMLLKNLGISQTKANTLLMESLVSEKIPFNPTQIKQATQLLKELGTKPEFIDIIKEMIVHKLPISEAAFQALQTEKTHSIGGLLSNMMALLQQKKVLQENEHILLRQLENLQIRPATNNLELVEQMVRVQPSKDMLSLLQLLHMIRPHVSEQRLTDFLSKLEIDKGISSFKSITNNGNKITDVKNIEQALGKIIAETPLIQKTATKILAIFPNLKTDKLTIEQMALLKNIVETELFPLLPDTAKQVLTETIQALNQPKVHEYVQFLSQVNQSSMMMKTLINRLRHEASTFLQSSINEQFVTHLKNYLNNLGIHDENILKQYFEQTIFSTNQLPNNQATIKSLLLPFIQQGSGSNPQLQEQAQTLIHFINGMQMQSVVESGNLLQATIQMPGNKLGLHEDIFMQFEGQRNTNGQINPDYCRIFFMLQLHHLEETMIDMHIQKRVISLTVFNDKMKQMPLNDTSLKMALKDRLTHLNYQLSSVTWKPLRQDDEKENKMDASLVERVNQGEGFDYKI